MEVYTIIGQSTEAIQYTGDNAGDIGQFLRIGICDYILAFGQNLMVWEHSSDVCIIGYPIIDDVYDREQKPTCTLHTSDWLVRDLIDKSDVRVVSDSEFSCMETHGSRFDITY